MTFNLFQRHCNVSRILYSGILYSGGRPAINDCINEQTAETYRPRPAYLNSSLVYIVQYHTLQFFSLDLLTNKLSNNINKTILPAFSSRNSDCLKTEGWNFFPNLPVLVNSLRAMTDCFKQFVNNFFIIKFFMYNRIITTPNDYNRLRRKIPRGLIYSCLIGELWL